MHTYMHNIYIYIIQHLDIRKPQDLKMYFRNFNYSKLRILRWGEHEKTRRESRETGKGRGRGMGELKLGKGERGEKGACPSDPALLGIDICR